MNKLTVERVNDLIEVANCFLFILDDCFKVENCPPVTFNEEVIQEASLDILVNVRGRYHLIDTKTLTEVSSNKENYINHVESILNKPFGFAGSVLMSYGRPVESLYRLEDLEGIYTEYIEMEGNRYIVKVTRNKGGKLKEQLMVVTVYPDTKKTTAIGIPGLLDLRSIQSAFKFNLDKNTKGFMVEKFMNSSNTILEIWVRNYLTAMVKRDPMSIKRTEEITKMYRELVTNLFVVNILNHQPVTRVIKSSIENVLLTQVTYDKDLIDELRLYSLNADEMVLALRLSRSFLNKYGYNGSTIFKLKTKHNIFASSFTLTKDTNEDVVSSIKETLDIIHSDFNKLINELE